MNQQVEVDFHPRDLNQHHHKHLTITSQRLAKRIINSIKSGYKLGTPNPHSHLGVRKVENEKSYIWKETCWFMNWSGWKPLVWCSFFFSFGTFQVLSPVVSMSPQLKIRNFGKIDRPPLPATSCQQVNLCYCVYWNLFFQCHLLWLPRENEEYLMKRL